MDGCAMILETVVALPDMVLLKLNYYKNYNCRMIKIEEMCMYNPEILSKTTLY